VEEFVADPLAVAAEPQTGRHQDFSLLKSVQGCTCGLLEGAAQASLSGR